MDAVIGQRTAHIQVVLEDIFQPHNASAVMRSCECFGIQHLHVVENRYTYTLNRDVAMGSSKWIDLHRHNDPQADNTAAAMDKLRGEGFRIAATSPDPDSIPLEDLDVSRPVSLWFGTEEDGLSPAVLEKADARVHIPMRGFTRSFNISVSAALCLYELRRRLEASAISWRLDPAERRRVQLDWLRNSIRNPEIVEAPFLEKRRGRG